MNSYKLRAWAVILTQGALRALFLAPFAVSCVLTTACQARAEDQRRPITPDPPVVAKADRHLWPETIDSTAGFDRASRASILVYVNVLSDMQTLSDSELIDILHVDTLDHATMIRWARGAWEASQQNYRLASSDCTASDWTCGAAVATPNELRDTSRKLLANMPATLDAWRAGMEDFSRDYLTEQLKLAAVFSRDNSEVDTFNTREWNGDRLPDREFFLTFDDGPTAPHGNTEGVLKMLDESRKSAVFFVLGSNLRTYLDKAGTPAVRTLYGQQCVASHGWEHHSHARWEPWQDSVKLTQALITGTISQENALGLFRPPYGQRRPDSEAFFRAQSVHVALWDIDSLDWNSHVSAEDAANRVIALMLVKRHGVMLFHDIHSKAKTALPIIFQQTAGSVSWGDCHALGRL